MNRLVFSLMMATALAAVAFLPACGQGKPDSPWWFSANLVSGPNAFITPGSIPSRAGIRFKGPIRTISTTTRCDTEKATLLILETCMAVAGSMDGSIPQQFQKLEASTCFEYPAQAIPISRQRYRVRITSDFWENQG